MTNEQYEKIGREMIEIYGDKLPDPEHSPIVFQYFFKLYMFYHYKGE